MRRREGRESDAREVAQARFWPRWVVLSGLLCGLLCSAPAASWAQGHLGTEEAAAPLGLRPIEELDLESLLNLLVVTASGGKEESKALAAANVVSVTREQIARHGWRSVAEVLSSTIGIYVVDDLVFPSVGVRGVAGGLRAGSRIVKVMINGVEVNFRPEFTAFLGPEYLPMEAVERIEIAKGPLSALYGANAFLAVVNVITRRPAQGWSTEVAARANSAGMNGGYGGSGMVSYGSERRTFVAAFGYDRIDRSGLRLQQTFPAQHLDPNLLGRESNGDLARPASAFLLFSAGARKGGLLTLQGGYQRVDSMGEFQLGSLLTHASRVALYNMWIDARYEREWFDGFTTRFILGWSKGAPSRDMVLYVTGTDNPRYTANYGYGAYPAGLELEYAPSERLSLRAGVETQDDSESVLYYTQTYTAASGDHAAGERVDLIGAADKRKYHLWGAAAYLQATSAPFAALPDLHLTGNVRLDSVDPGSVRIPSELSWRVAAAYQWTPRLATKLIAGRAFQFPSGVLLFAHPGLGDADNIVGNLTHPGLPLLKPQKVSSVEAVSSAELGGSLDLEGGFFFQKLDDQTGFVRTGADFMPANDGTRQTLGLELSARVASKRFSPYLTGSYLHGLSGQKALPLSPSAIAVAGADLDLPEYHLHVNSQVRWVGSRGTSSDNARMNGVSYTLPPYADLDLTLSSVGLRFWGGAESRFIATVRNALDERHSEPGFGGVDLPVLGRTAMLELRQSY